MERVTGIGGVFFKADNPKALTDWYRRHIGVPVGADGHAFFPWREEADRERLGKTVWSAFPRDTKYFEPSAAPFMINYRVRDLDRLLEALRREGVEVDRRIEEGENGRFAWVMDPEGNRIELWEPPE
jgi:catechol 2,3-dioxygenase-like lactoylglutathione lyase family enzyme